MPRRRSLSTSVPAPLASQVTIVGLGLIGGSLALALRERLPNTRVIGIDRDEVIGTESARALVQGCVSESDRAATEEALAGSDLVFLAAPVHVIRCWLERALAHRAVVTDCGSTKREIVQSARAVPGAARFVPGHPMAGGAGGRAAARSDLFERQPWLLCPEGVEPAALAVVERLVASVGGRTVLMSAEAHDRAVAVTSHAPRVVFSALAALAQRTGAFAAAGPAFERVLRGAGGDESVWRDVLESNADEVAQVLRELAQTLLSCAADLARREELEQCLAALREGNAARAAFDAHLLGRSPRG